MHRLNLAVRGVTDREIPLVGWCHRVPATRTPVPFIYAAQPTMLLGTGVDPVSHAAGSGNVALRTSTRSRGRTVFGVIAVVALWLAALAAPAGASSGSTVLMSPSISPAAGTPSTPITFSVVYQNHESSGADWVHVSIDGVAHDMAPTSGTAKSGVEYAYTSTLQTGAHEVVFSSSGRGKFEGSLSGGTVTISSPPPTPKPTPKPTPTPAATTPTPKPTPTPAATTPTPKPTPTPAATPTVPGVPAVGGPTIPGGDGTGSGGDAAAGGSPGGDPASAGGGTPSGSGPDSGATAPSQGDPALGPAAGDGAPGSNSLDSAVGAASADGGRGTSQAALEAGIPGLPGSDQFGRLSRLAPFATLLSTMTTLALAFLLFGKKRRDEEPTGSNRDLAAAAASPYTMFGAGLVPTFIGVDPGRVDPGTGGTDVDLPRWRRPSLLAARKSDPVRNGAEHVNLTFELQGAPTAGGERQVVRYRLVRLLDRPDELLGQAVDSLDDGDEVEVLERHGTYRRVVTPDGRQGWLHRMTLGDIVTDDLASIPGSSGLGDDFLSAYIAARTRA